MTSILILGDVQNYDALSHSLTHSLTHTPLLSLSPRTASHQTSDPVTRLALGMLHVSSMLGGSGEADAILAHRYTLLVSVSEVILVILTSLHFAPLYQYKVSQLPYL